MQFNQTPGGGLVRATNRHNRTRRFLLGILSACALACSLVAVPAAAQATTSEELRAQLSDASSQLDSLMSQTGDSIASLEETRDAIQQTEQLINETRSSLDQKAQEVARMQGDLSVIIANDYKNQGDLGLFAFILGASDYDDLVSRLYYAEHVTKQKQRSLDTLHAAQDDMMSVQRDLQAKKADLEELAAQQEGQAEELQASLSSLQSYVDGLPSEIQKAVTEENAARLEDVQSKANNLIGESEKKEESKSDKATDETPSAEDSKQESEPSPAETPAEEKPAQSQPADPSGGSQSDVANYIGPQAGWSGDTGYIAAQQGILNSAGSGTNWGCVVDKGSGRCVVFRRDGGVWKAAMTTDVITTGHTFTGNWTVVFHARAYWALPDGYDVNDWWVCFIEAWSRDNYNGHLRYENGKGFDDGQGFHYGYSSGGCTVISNYSTAQWLYDHVPDGSRVVVY